MSSFWKMFKNTVREKKEQAAEKMADPIRDGKFAIADSKAKLGEIQSNIAKYSAQIKKNQRSFQAAQEDLKKWNNLAKTAAGAGNEDDVRKCIGHKSQAQQQVNNLKKMIVQDETMLNNMKNQWQKKNNQVSQAESNHTQLAVRKQMAEARKEFAKSTQGLDSDNCFAELDKLQQTVESDECEAEALEEMAPVNDIEDMSTKYGSTGDSAVDDEVAKMMANASK